MRRRSDARLKWLVLLLIYTAASVGGGDRVSAATAAGGALAPGSNSGIVGWTEVERYSKASPHADQGVATVSPPSHRPYELYRGDESIPRYLLTHDWIHIGDPDSVDGYMFDAYQGSSSARSKMFLVTTPSDRTYQYRHALVPGELYNNSFVTISPDNQWMVAGEWESMSHLQVYPTPILNHETASDGGLLPLAGYIWLDHKVDDIQGCDFVTPITLLCTSENDPPNLFRNQMPLVEIELSASLSGTSVSGHVVDLGSLPQESQCSGLNEPEGVDFDVYTGILRVEIVPPGPCKQKTTIYEYKSAV